MKVLWAHYELSDLGLLADVCVPLFLQFRGVRSENLCRWLWRIAAWARGVLRLLLQVDQLITWAFDIWRQLLIQFVIGLFVDWNWWMAGFIWRTHLLHLIWCVLCAAEGSAGFFWGRVVMLSGTSSQTYWGLSDHHWRISFVFIEERSAVPTNH